MKKIVTLLLFLLICVGSTSFVLGEGEYPSYITDAETAIADAWTAIGVSQGEGVDTSNEESTLLKVEGLLDSAKTVYDEGDEYQAEQIAGTIVGISGEIVVALQQDEPKDEGEGTPEWRSLRLLLLKRGVAYNLAYAQAIVVYAQENEIEATELEDIVLDMEVLVEDIQAVDMQGDDYRKVFVSLKKRANTLARSFRTILWTTFSRDEIKDIREMKNDIRKSLWDEYADKIVKAKEIIKTHRLQVFAKKFGVDSSGIMDQLQAGEIDFKQATKMVKNQIKEQRRQQIRERLEQAKEQRNAEKNGRSK